MRHPGHVLTWTSLVARKAVDGSIAILIKTFSLDQIVEAHQAMDNSTAFAKSVVLM